MKFRQVGLLSAIALVLMISGCENSEGPDYTEHRYLYYAIGGNNSAEAAGLYRYTLADGAKEKIDNLRSDYCTPVADNGIVLYEATEGSQKLFGYCENGTIIPVPFPQHPDPTMEYVYSMPPRVDLAANGHHAVYAVDLVPAGVQNPSTRKCHLVVFDCLNWKMTLVNIDSLLADRFAANNIKGGSTTGSFLFANRTGSHVWFAAELTDTQNNPAGYVLAQWSAEGLEILEGISASLVSPVAYNDKMNALTIAKGNDVSTIRLASMERIPFEVPSAVGLVPWTFGNALDISVRWEDDGIAIHSAVTGERVYRIAELSQFEAAAGETYAYGDLNSLAIAPDGKWIALTLSPASHPSRRDLYVLRTNGEDIRKLDENIPAGLPSVSPRVME